MENRGWGLSQPLEETRMNFSDRESKQMSYSKAKMGQWVTLLQPHSNSQTVADSGKNSLLRQKVPPAMAHTLI